jgi:hypothetical protein
MESSENRKDQQRKSFLISLVTLLLFIAAFLWLFFSCDVPQLRELAQPPGPPVPPGGYGKYLSDVQYDTETGMVTGAVTGVSDPRRFGVIVYIHSAWGYFPKPYEDSAVNEVAPDGKFTVQAFSDNEPNDKKTEMYGVLLVDKNLNYGSLAEQAESEGKPVWELAQEYASDKLWDLPTYNS